MADKPRRGGARAGLTSKEAARRAEKSAGPLQKGAEGYTGRVLPSSPSDLDEILDALSVLAGYIGRRALWVLLGLLIFSALSTCLFVLRDPGRTLLLVPWVGLVGGLWAYVGEIRQARRALTRAVAGETMAEPPTPPEEKGQGWSGRAQSILLLARAFEAARWGDSIGAEIRLARVERADLGEQESRLYDAVRVLVALDRGEERRASQLAPLALPTGNAAIDRTIGRLMVQAAWGDEDRLAAVERALQRTGRPVRPLALLCSARRSADQGSQLPLAERFRVEVSEEARRVGDDALAEEVLSWGSRRGGYR